MALSVALSDGTTTVTLSDQSAYGLEIDNVDLGMPTFSRVFSQPWARGYAPLTGRSVQNREMHVGIRIRATSVDTWIANEAAIAALLKAAQDFHESQGRLGKACTFTVQLDGATNATVFDVLAGEINAAQLGRQSLTVTSAPFYRDAMLTLWTKPYGRPASLTSVTSNGLNNGGGTGNSSGTYTLAAPAGQYDTPLRLTMQSAAPLKRFVAGRRTRDNTSNFARIWALNAVATDSATTPSSYPGYTVQRANFGGDFAFARTAEASAHNGAVLTVSASGGAGETGSRWMIKWKLDENISDLLGRYRAFLRVDRSSGGSASGATANFFAVSLLAGGNSATHETSNPPVVLPKASASQLDYLVDLGTFQIPTRDIGATESISEFWLGLGTSYNFAAGGSSNTRYMFDNLYLIPADEEFLDLRASATNLASNDKLVVDDIWLRPFVAAMTSANVVRPITIEQIARSQIHAVPGRPNLWAALALKGNGSGAIYTSHDLTDTFNLNFQYHPLSDLYR